MATTKPTAPYVLVWFVTHCHVSFAMLHSSINSFSISLVIGFNYKLFYMQNILNCTRTEFHRTLNLLIQVPLTQQDGGKQPLMNSCLNVFANENATVSCADSAACNPAIQSHACSVLSYVALLI